MKISFVITGFIELDDSWGTAEQIQSEIKRDFPEAIAERAYQWRPGLHEDTRISSICTTLLQ